MRWSKLLAVSKSHHISLLGMNDWESAASAFAALQSHLRAFGREIALVQVIWVYTYRQSTVAQSVHLKFVIDIPELTQQREMRTEAAIARLYSHSAHQAVRKHRNDPIPDSGFRHEPCPQFLDFLQLQSWSFRTIRSDTETRKASPEVGSFRAWLVAFCVLHLGLCQQHLLLSWIDAEAAQECKLIFVEYFVWSVVACDDVISEGVCSDHLGH